MSISAEEALERARAIAAKLSGGGGGTAPSIISTGTTVAIAPTTSSIGASTTSVFGQPATTIASTTTATATTHGKRKRWGVLPDAAVAGAAAVTPSPSAASAIAAAGVAAALAAGAKRAKTGDAAGTEQQEEKIVKRLWVRPPATSSTDDDDEEVANNDDGETTKPKKKKKKKPPAHYVKYLTRHFDQVLQSVHDELGIPMEDNNKKKEEEKTGDNNGGDDSSNSGAGRVKSNLLEFEMDGKGASDKPAIPGMPQQPLHVRIEGTSRAAVQLAALKFDVVLMDAHDAPLEEGVSESDYEDDDDYGSSSLLTEKSNTALALIPASSGGAGHYGPGGASSSTYRPASVAQLIGQTHMSSDSMRSGDGDNGGPMLTEETSVPHGVIGYIIGRGGETIASLQMKTGCKVQIQKESELQPGQAMRLLTLSSTSQQSIDECKGMIEKMVQERVRSLGGVGGSGGGVGGGASGGGGGKDNKIQEAVAAGHIHLEVEVPEADVGLVIGKQGATIRSIQDQTGACVQVPPSEGGGGDPSGKKTRTVHITHPTQEGAQAAKQQVETILSNRASYRNGGGGGGMQPQGQGQPQTTIQVHVPDKDVGLCIGRGGSVIRHMQTTTRTRIQIPAQPVPGQAYRIATISGPQEGCNRVRQMIQQIVTEQSSTSVMGGTTFVRGGIGGMQQQQQRPFQPQQQYGAPQNNQQEYSAEWAAYHAAQAAAQQQQQQYAAPTTAPAAAPAAAAVAPAPAAGQPAADAYYEQFFRYAYYYGEEAARTYYGAWSPPAGTPNPYGTNPEGIKPAPAQQAPAPEASAPAAVTAAAAPTAGQVPATAPAEAVTARETGRRKVSNLPAWMTKG